MLAVIGTLLGVALGLLGTGFFEVYRSRRDRAREVRERRVAALYAMQEHIPPVVECSFAFLHSERMSPHRSLLLAPADEHLAWLNIYASRIGDAELTKAFLAWRRDVLNLVMAERDPAGFVAKPYEVGAVVRQAEAAVTGRIEALLRQAEGP